MEVKRKFQTPMKIEHFLVNVLNNRAKTEIRALVSGIFDVFNHFFWICK